MGWRRGRGSFAHTSEDQPVAEPTGKDYIYMVLHRRAEERARKEDRCRWATCGRAVKVFYVSTSTGGEREYRCKYVCSWALGFCAF